MTPMNPVVAVLMTSQIVCVCGDSMAMARTPAPISKAANGDGMDHQFLQVAWWLPGRSFFLPVYLAAFRMIAGHAFRNRVNARGCWSAQELAFSFRLCLIF